jgi:hypothetical protein
VTDRITDWLHAQLDEDDRIARAAQRQRGGGQWTARADANEIVAVEGIPARASEPIPVVLHPDEDETAVHVAEHDPARVLREIDAKRRIVDRYAWLCEHGDTGGAAWVLPLLALPYADRPGYKEAWRP